MAEIYSIVYKPERVPGEPKAFYRVPLEAANLIAGYGIEGDVKGGHPKRQLNVMTYETMEALKAEGFKTAPGELGEHLAIKGLDVATLAPGDRIQIGDSAVIEIMGLREPCERFEYAQDKSLEDAIARVGVMARVLTNGAIRVGDAVTAVPVTA
jgi:MOSC domain-containing protein YiiM